MNLIDYVEIFAVVTSLLFLFFSIKQNVLLWLFGIICSLSYIYVYFETKFYADMSLQVYYFFVSIYGWYYWIFGKKKEEKQLPVTLLDFKSRSFFLFIMALLFVLMAYILKKFTDSDIPYWDSFTTAGSIVATWMLVKKKIEHWIIWIVVDSVSAGLYWYKELYFTVILFIVYTVMAVIGYIQWKKQLHPDHE